MQFELAGSETILVVDDEAFSLDSCCEMLAGTGYRVLRAQTAAESLSLCESHKNSIALALVDVVMPGMNGIQLSKRIEELYGIKIALISGYSRPEVDQLIGADGSGFRIFWKPFDLRIFLQMIRNVLDAPVPSRAHAGRP